MKLLPFILVSTMFVTSCIKKQYGCVLNKTALFEVNNRSSVTAKFVLIQNSDTIRETILPWKDYQYTIKAGVETKATVYIADTVYVQSRSGWKIKRCQIDSDLIRF
jgi:hypothetical protein